MSNTPPKGTQSVLSKDTPFTKEDSTDPRGRQIAELKWSIEQNQKMFQETMAQSAKIQESMVAMTQIAAEHEKLRAVHKENEKQREHESSEAYEQRQHEEQQRKHEERQREHEERKQVRDQEEAQRNREEAERIRKHQNVARLTWLLGVPAVLSIFAIAGGLVATGHLKEAAEFAFLVATNATAYLTGKKNSLSADDAKTLKNIINAFGAKPVLLESPDDSEADKK